MGIVKEMSSAIWEEERMLHELEAIEENEKYTDEEREAAREDWMNSIIQSVQSIAKTAGFMISLEFRAKSLRDEKREIVERYDAKIQATDRFIMWIENKILDYMTENSMKEIPAGAFSYKIRKSEAVIIEDIGAIPEEYVKTVVTQNPDKLAIKQAIKSGIDIPGASIETRDNLQVR